MDNRSARNFVKGAIRIALNSLYMTDISEDPSELTYGSGRRAGYDFLVRDRTGMRIYVGFSLGDVAKAHALAIAIKPLNNEYEYIDVVKPLIDDETLLTKKGSPLEKSPEKLESYHKMMRRVESEDGFLFELNSDSLSDTPSRRKAQKRLADTIGEYCLRPLFFLHDSPKNRERIEAIMGSDFFE